MDRYLYLALTILRQPNLRQEEKNVFFNILQIGAFWLSISLTFGVWWFSSKSFGYPSQLYKVLIFCTSNLDNSPSGLSLKVAKFQNEFWFSFYVPKMNKISVCQPFCLYNTSSWKVISFILWRHTDYRVIHGNVE